MKVLIRNEKEKKKIFIEIMEISFSEKEDGTFTLIATDILGRKIILKKLTQEKVNDIEYKICQDYVIDLTEGFEEFQKRQTPQEILMPKLDNQINRLK